MQERKTEVVSGGFLPIEEAIIESGMSRATIERRAADGRVRVQHVPQAGAKPKPYYSIEDLLELKKEKEMRRALRPPSAIAPKPAEPKAVQLQLPEEVLALTRALVAAQTKLLAPLPEPEPPVPVTEKLWLTIREATRLSGIPRRYLRALCDDPASGLLARRFGRSWRVNRESLQAWKG
jgi:excisionase family DNA binding protein